MHNFDANAGHTLLPCIVEFLRSANYDFTNPSSIHRGGQKARAKIEEAREFIRELTNAKDYRIVFTSGATESNNTAIYQAGSVARIVASTIEHPSVLEYLGKDQKTQQEIMYYGFEQICELDFDVMKTDFLSCMVANNETGDLIDIVDLAQRCKAINPRLKFHSDAVQALGKVDLDLGISGLDFVSLSSHKIGGLAGVGALLVRDGVDYVPYLNGGPQEVHHRSGTENVIGIIAFGMAAKNWKEHALEYRLLLKQQRDYIEEYLRNNISEINFWHNMNGLVNTLSVQFSGVRADDLVVAMDMQNYNISSGAACASGKPEPSHVLLAKGIPEIAARESVRISLEVGLNDTVLKNFCEALVSTVNKFRLNENK